MTHTSHLIINRLVLEAYSHYDVTVLRLACRVFCPEFLQIGNIEVFLESLIIASACNKVLRRKLFKSNTIGLSHTVGYTCNYNYSKNAIM